MFSKPLHPMMMNDSEESVRPKNKLKVEEGIPFSHKDEVVKADEVGEGEVGGVEEVNEVGEVEVGGVEEVNEVGEGEVDEKSSWSDKINETLREEIRATHKAYKTLLENQEKENDDLYKMLDQDRQSSEKIESLYNEQINSLQSRVNNLDDQNDSLQNENTALLSSEKGWIGRTLKLEFIFKKMIQAGAIQPDHAEWVLPMFEDIDIPNVPESTKEEFVPTSLTGLVGDTDEEDEYLTDDGGDSSSDEEMIVNGPNSVRILPRREHIVPIEPTEYITARMIMDYYREVYPEEFADEDTEKPLVTNFDDVTSYPNPPGYDSLPWYERRFPTLNEISSASLIQKIWRNRQ